MNSLGRDIQQGEVVVVGLGKKHERALVCTGGFGMRQGTMGTALIGHWYGDAPENVVRVDSMSIIAKETEKFQQALAEEIAEEDVEAIAEANAEAESPQEADVPPGEAS